MRYTSPAVAPAVLLVALSGVGCQSTPSGSTEPLQARVAEPSDFGEDRLGLIHTSQGFQWTGVASTDDGRVFVSFPNWDGPYRWAVCELVDGAYRPYPDGQWNRWPPAAGEIEADPAYRFVCVQSVYADSKNRLWVLDPASPNMAGVVPGAAKLVEIDLDTDRVVRVIRFDDSIAPERSYLNDVRIDTERDVAFITDSGLGAIVVVDLNTNTSRRVLANHKSTKAERGVVPVIDNRELRVGQTPRGAVPQIHADGIAYNPVDDYVYYQALTGRTLHRVPAGVLADVHARAFSIAAAVERVGPSVITDGMAADAEGNVYFTALEHNAIVYRTPEGEYRTLVQSGHLAWPDSLAVTPDGLYVTTSRIHETKKFSFDGLMPGEPYGLWRAPRPE